MPSILTHVARRSSRLVAAAIACMAATGTLAAQPADTIAPFKSAKTSAGLTFHWRHDPVTPYAAINFGMRDPYALITRGKEGLIDLGGSLLMQGADGGGQAEFIETLRDLTASASFSIGPFNTLGSVRAPPSTLPAATALVAAALARAEPEPKLLARLVARSQAGEAQSVLRAETIAQRAALRLALGDHPLTRTQDPDRFQRIAITDLDAWRQRSLDRSRLRIAVSGRIGEGEAATLVDRAFATLPTGKPPQRIELPKVTLRPATVVIETETAQSAVLIVGRTSIGTAREVETGNIVNSILGGGASSRLWQAVRAGLGATYGAGSSFIQTGPGQRLIAMRTAVDNDQVKAAVNTIRATYATWREKGVRGTEIAPTVSRMVNDLRSTFDDPSRANGVIVAALLAGRSLDEVYSIDRRLSALGPDSANEFISTKFPAPEDLLTVIVTTKADGLNATCVIKALAEIETCRTR